MRASLDVGKRLPAEEEEETYEVMCVFEPLLNFNAHHYVIALSLT